MTVDHFAHPTALQCHYYQANKPEGTPQVWNRLDFMNRPRCDRCQNWLGGQCRVYQSDSGPV